MTTLDYEELDATIGGLLADLDDRLDPDQAQIARMELDAGEWHMAVEGLVATLNKRKVPITAAEHRTLLDLVDTLKLDTGAATSLEVRQDTDDPNGTSTRPSPGSDGTAATGEEPSR